MERFIGISFRGLQFPESFELIMVVSGTYQSDELSVLDFDNGNVLPQN